MSYAYLLAGENLELAEAELRGFLKSQNIGEGFERSNRMVETNAEPGQLKRLAFTHEVSKIKDRSDSRKFEPSYKPDSSYAVRVENLTNQEINKKDLEAYYGDKLGSEGNSVDLENPDETIKIYVLEEEVIVGVLAEDINRGLFDKRKNQNRPFSSPISLDPVLARVMVNLSETKPGEFLLDPFCGTGGILIEAGLCGIGVKGLDISEDMVRGTRQNLEEYGIITHDIKQESIENLFEKFSEDFEAVVTDLPYGKASKEIEDPVEKFLNKIENLEDKDIVFMYNEPNLGDFTHSFEVYVHKNLTRYIYVL